MSTYYIETGDAMRWGDTPPQAVHVIEDDWVATQTSDRHYYCTQSCMRAALDEDFDHDVAEPHGSIMVHETAAGDEGVYLSWGYTYDDTPDDGVCAYNDCREAL